MEPSRPQKRLVRITARRTIRLRLALAHTQPRLEPSRIHPSQPAGQLLWRCAPCVFSFSVSCFFACEGLFRLSAVKLCARRFDLPNVWPRCAILRRHWTLALGTIRSGRHSHRGHSAPSTLDVHAWSLSALAPLACLRTSLPPPPVTSHLCSCLIPSTLDPVLCACLLSVPRTRPSASPSRCVRFSQLRRSRRLIERCNETPSAPTHTLLPQPLLAAVTVGPEHLGVCLAQLPSASPLRCSSPPCAPDESRPDCRVSKQFNSTRCGSH